MTALLHIFPPEGAEGPIEYLRRLSFHNGYSDWRSLVRATGLNPSLNALWKNQPALSDTLGLDPEWLRTVMPAAQAGTGLHDPYFRRTSVDAICPACLAEGNHLHHAWSHSLVSACPIHGTTLLDACPCCGTPLAPDRFDPATCECGYDLREATAEVAGPFEIWVSARLAGDMRPVESLPEIGTPEDYATLGKLLFSLAVRLDPTAKVKPAKASRPHDVAQTRTLLDSIRPLFSCWPEGFNAHVRERLAAGNQTQFSPSGRLGPWYGALHGMSRKAHAFAPLWTAFSDAMLEHFDGNLRGQKVLTPSPDRERRFVPLATAAQLLEVGASKLSAALQAGIVSGHFSRQGTAYTMALMDRAEVERIQIARARWIYADAAASMAGVPLSVITHLTKAGVLVSDERWALDISKGGPIEKASLDALLERLTSHLVPRDVPDTLRFGQLVGRRTTDIKGLHQLYRAISSGEVRPVRLSSDAFGLDGFSFSTDDVRRYLGSVGLAEGMTLTQLEKVTSWKYEAISHWADIGLLRTINVTLHGRAARLVSHAALAEFRNDWIPIADLARAMGSKSSALTKKAQERGLIIYGQRELQGGAKRGGLLRLADLASFVFA